LEAQQSKTASNLGKKEYLAKGSADYWVFSFYF
jgi:hypothetical protein